MEEGGSEKQPLLESDKDAKMRRQHSSLSATEATLLDPTSPNQTKPEPNGNRLYEPVQFTYQELSDGFTCPSCHGRGKIPRGQEADLVALIPYNDSRLKPRRTFLSVLVSVLACATLAGVLCAFLVPRQLEMKVIGVETQAVSINTTIPSMSLLLQTEFSVYNKNFVSAYSQNATVTAYWSDQIKGVNTTIMSATIGGRKSHAIFANVTATFVEPFLVSYCDGPSPTHIIYMQFV
ncbi:transmembrane protein 106B-like [Diadema antillarum]|uniref:transmembrane protein 106B-like n=1 Tax=Diadema antillarum TaxID=105358 RepID=UPI003A873E2A